MPTPPPPHSHGQVLFCIPLPPPPGLHHVPAQPPPVPIPSSFVSATHSPFPPSAPPPSPPPPPSSPPPLPPSPPPTSQTTEFSAVPKAPSSDMITPGVADASVAPNDNEVGSSGNNCPVVTAKASEELPSPPPKPMDEKDSRKDEEQNVPSTSPLKVEGSSQSGIIDDEGSVSPTASDMDMEYTSIDQFSRKSAGEALSLGCELLARSTTEQLVPEPAASSILPFTAFPQ